MDVPDWFWQGVTTNLVVDSMGLAAWLAWKYRADILALLEEALRVAAEQADAVARYGKAELESSEALEALEAARAIARDVLTIPAWKYEPMKVRWIPPKYTYEPMRLRYVPMRWTVRNGIPHILSMPTFTTVPARWNVKPGHLDFTHGRFTILEG